MNKPNHYQTLGISPNASAQEVKKAFRKLALRFHPDKNVGEEKNEIRFLMVQEAYAVLDNPEKRKAYDREYWLRQPGILAAPDPTPMSVLKESIRLRQYTANVNVFSLDQEALTYHVLRILSDRHISMLRELPNDRLNEQVLIELITASEGLDYRHACRIIGQLKKFAAGQPDYNHMVDLYEQKRKRSDYADRLTPVAALFIVLLLCWLIYQYGKN